MVIMEAALCHAVLELKPGQGHAAQEMLVLRIVREVQATAQAVM